MPHPTDLHFIIPIHKRPFLRNGRERHVWDGAPVVFEVVRNDKSRSSLHEIHSAVVVVMVVMGYQEVRRILLKILSDPPDNEKALVRRGVDGHYCGAEVGD